MHVQIASITLLCLLYWPSRFKAFQTSPVIGLCRTSGHFAMTFDDGPSILTGAVLDAFDERKLKANFHPVIDYLNDVTIVANLQRAASSGHLIGLSLGLGLEYEKMSDDELISAIDTRAQVLESYIGIKPKYLRIPNYNRLSASQISLIFAKGYVITTYNLDSYDYTNISDVLGSFKKILDLLSNNTKGGFISVQRDSVMRSVRETGDIIDYILSKGYTIVTLDECVTNVPFKATGGDKKNPLEIGSKSNDPSATNQSGLSPLPTNRQKDQTFGAAAQNAGAKNNIIALAQILLGSLAWILSL